MSCDDRGDQLFHRRFNYKIGTKNKYILYKYFLSAFGTSLKRNVLIVINYYLESYFCMHLHFYNRVYANRWQLKL